MEKLHLQHTKQLISRQLKDVNTMQLGDIVSYSGGRASVKLADKIWMGGKYHEQATLIDVPVFQMQTPNFAIEFPMKNMPIPCMVIFAQRSIAGRMSNGGQNAVADTRHHDLSDAIALVGLPHQKTFEENHENLRIRSAKGEGMIEMSDDGRYRITNGNEDLLKILSSALQTLARTKAVVSQGSSAGNWDIDTQADFGSLNTSLEKIIL